jgi:cytosine/adenosine deaminase-related metal-dependent hydrolase
MESILLKNGLVLTQNDHREILRADVRLEGGRITHVCRAAPNADIVIDCSSFLVMPGFVQTHIHLNQALFRSLADDLSLLDWLEHRIYRYEAAHTRDSIYWSGRIACEELLAGGTTCIADMGSVLHADACFCAMRDSGMRGSTGKMLMDKQDSAPDILVEGMDAALKESLSLMDRWHTSHGGRLRFLFSPRFALSCTDAMLREIAKLSSRHHTLVHTHASENREEVRTVRSMTGMDNVAYLSSVGLLSSRLLLAHCIWVTDAEIALLASNHVNVLHCPLANLKLASGIAPVHRMASSGINISLGSDGAPCNNTLDMFNEMRFAALIHKVRDYDPTVLPAQQVLDMATRNGARAMGLGDRAGQLVPGAYADVAVIDMSAAHLTPFSHPVSMVVYAAKSSDVVITVVDGVICYRRGPTTKEKEQLYSHAATEQRKLLERAETSD